MARECDIMARFNGGSNAGHTVVVTIDEKTCTYKFHLIPSGMSIPGKIGVVGPGVLLNVPKFFEEADGLIAEGITDLEQRLLVSDRAQMVFAGHMTLDKAREMYKSKAGTAIGTTGQGIGPALESKAARQGCRVGVFINKPEEFERRHREVYKTIEAQLKGLAEASARDEEMAYAKEHNEDLSDPSVLADIENDIIDRRTEMFDKITADMEEMCSKEITMLNLMRERLRPMVTDTIVFLHDAYNAGKKIIAEGANAALLDCDLGTYPFSTGSNCTIGAVCTGLGINPSMIGECIGITKAYTTRVGNGPFPTELKDDVGDHMQKVGREVGTTTGRKRRCGWFDACIARFSHMLNGYTSLVLTKLDVLTGLETLKIGVSYATKDGDVLFSVPGDINDLEGAEVQYLEIPGWTEDISKTKVYEELPAAVRAYIEKIEELTGVFISAVGVGPGRDETIIRSREKHCKLPLQ
jgi:adenylosuccinate synthase